MANSEVVLRFGKRTGDQVMEAFSDLEKATTVTIGDLLYAGQRQRTRILQRTARGVDVNETAFHPYSLKGPIYYYPGKNNKSRKAAVNRVSKKIGISGNSKTLRVAGARGQYVQKTRLGLKFSSYAALKAAFGRLNVDLRGLKAPHMLQALIVRVADFVLGNPDQTFQPLPTVSLEPASEMTIGIYGFEAERASGHQNGRGHLPQRRFLGANMRDQELMLQDIIARMKYRASAILGGGSLNKEGTL